HGAGLISKSSHKEGAFLINTKPLVFFSRLTIMENSNLSLSPSLIRPLVIVLLIASVLWGVLTWNYTKGADLFQRGALFIGTSVTNWTINRFEAALKASGLPVPGK